MTEEEAIKILDRLIRKWSYDVEAAHKKADNVLVEFLRSLGYEELADTYEMIPKWYA